MDRKFFCHNCEESFSSWPEMKRHFRSKEHKDRFGTGRTELILKKITKCFKEITDGSSKV